jgi:hypothetical protein
MSKHRHQNKAHQTNREGGSISVGPETSNQGQEQMESLQSDFGFVPSYEEVQRRAYQIHEERGGSDLENWLEAERALKEEHHLVEH